jgi:hypothetical protein
MSSPINNTGFKESLKPNPNKSVKLTPTLTPKKSDEICKSILKTGNKILNGDKYVIPSQFPILTSKTKTNKKVGGKKNKKTLKKRIKNIKKQRINY